MAFGKSIGAGRWTSTTAMGAALMVGCLAAPNAALAQVNSEEAEETTEGNSIIVTARRQEETLQDVPVAVSVVGSEALENFRIDEAADLISRVPALSVQVGGSGAGAQIGIRGINSSNISNAFDSAVAINVDGIAVSTQRILQTAFFDLEQVRSAERAAAPLLW